jgi:hypothetical protein
MILSFLNQVFRLVQCNPSTFLHLLMIHRVFARFLFFVIPELVLKSRLLPSWVLFAVEYTESFRMHTTIIGQYLMNTR